ncbi:hypothetical protein MGH68_01550 [Erysipelothrix sp. D19-032]
MPIYEVLEEEEDYHEKRRIKICSSSISILVSVDRSVVQRKVSKEQVQSETVTLQVYQIGDAPKNIKELTDKINTISEKEIGVKVNFTYIGWGDYDQKMSVMVTKRGRI